MMTLLKKRSVLFLFLILIFITGKVQSQGSDLEGKRAEVEKIEAELLTLKEKQQELTKKAGHLAQKISDLKEKENLGFVGRFNLDRALKKSQQLSAQLDQVGSQIARVQEVHRTTVDSLKKLYDIEIDYNRRALKDARFNKDRETEIAILFILMELRGEKNALEGRTGRTEIDEDAIPDVTIGPLDGPEEIREKADLIKDMEDRLRARSVLLDQCILDVTEEGILREKIDQFMKEAALFDERGGPTTSGLRSSGKAAAPMTADYAEEVRDLSAGNWLAIKARATGLVPYEVDSWKQLWEQIVIDELYSPNDMAALLDVLSREREELVKKAAELSQKAERFYQEAERQKSGGK
ncbi:hypothetical protein ISS37_01590 [candidate division KSB1 bacterium]|nr:hypothetical protein [candidate division KSB1 bacterium]